MLKNNSNKGVYEMKENTWLWLVKEIVSKKKNASFCELLKIHFRFAFDNAGNSGSSLNLI